MSQINTTIFPLNKLGRELVISILKTAEFLQYKLAVQIKKEGLTLPAYNVLLVLQKSERGLPTLEIGKRIDAYAPGITRLIDGLEKKKLVQRIRLEVDRRVVLCRITTLGLQCLKILKPQIELMEKSCVSNLTNEQCHRIIALLSHIQTPS